VYASYDICFSQLTPHFPTWVPPDYDTTSSAPTSGYTVSGASVLYLQILLLPSASYTGQLGIPITVKYAQLTALLLSSTPPLSFIAPRPLLNVLGTCVAVGFRSVPMLSGDSEGEQAK
jgi:hypothetical protein